MYPRTEFPYEKFMEIPSPFAVDHSQTGKPCRMSLDSRSRRKLLQTLESLHAAGVQQIPSPQRELARKPVEAELPVQSPAIEASPTSGSPGGANLFEGDQQESDISAAPNLELLTAEVASCTLCGELASTRTQTVFGVGNPNARLCFLGEAPGADEDRLGEPFVGRAGQLLDKILAACNLKREEVYILNILKCRPPDNRNPTPQESQNCRRFFERQLQLISPEFICCLGAVAAQNLLATPMAIGRMRGKVLQYKGIKVVCTYHPAYLLRNPDAKKLTWDDMKLLMREMGTPVD